MKHRYTFGPVPSRRLGRSLGIDIVPFKTCTYDCIYCQLGRTTNRTLQREEYVPLDDVLRDVEAVVAAGTQVDYLTLSGSGEPTLHSGVGDLVMMLKREFACPVAVLTNGSLLHRPEIAEALMPADVVVPTVAADSETVYQCVHRPAPGLHFDAVMQGLIDFSHDFRNHLWLEVFMLDGVTAVEGSVLTMKRLVERMRVERIQLNTVTRPPAEDFATAVSASELRDIAAVFGERAEVACGHPPEGEGTAQGREDIEAALLGLLRRRPCTVEDTAAALSIHRVEALKFLDHLADRGAVAAYRQGEEDYYRIVEAAE